jgi:glycerol dehydrogenase-like iron-containing ADH family enzyme
LETLFVKVSTLLAADAQAILNSDSSMPQAVIIDQSLLSAAAINFVKSGWGQVGRDLNSG